MAWIKPIHLPNFFKIESRDGEMAEVLTGENQKRAVTAVRSAPANQQEEAHDKRVPVGPSLRVCEVFQGGANAKNARASGLIGLRENQGKASDAQLAVPYLPSLDRVANGRHLEAFDGFLEHVIREASATVDLRNGFFAESMAFHDAWIRVAREYIEGSQDKRVKVVKTKTKEKK